MKAYCLNEYNKRFVKAINLFAYKAIRDQVLEELNVVEIDGCAE